VTVPSVALHSTLKPGDMIRGRYKILSVIGAGSYSTVYHVEGLQIEGTRWATKELREDTIDEKEREIIVRLFKKEARLLQELNHTGIPKVIDHFSLGSNHFMVLEYVEGETLQMKMEREAIDTKSVTTWAIKICDILDYLQSLKPYPLVYRDLKPSNIMITSSGRIMLIDFGIARFFKPHRARDTCFLGTPGFCPPEQYGTCQSNVSNDIYSLGATLYYLLTGVDLEHLHYRIPPISHFNKSVSPKLEKIIEKCMRVEPGRRYRSIIVLRKDLKRAEERNTSSIHGPAPIFSILHGPIPRITRLLKDASCRTKLLDAYPQITRLFIDVPCFKSALSTLSKGRLQPRLIRRPAPILWVGALIVLFSAFLLTVLVIPHYKAQQAQYAERERYRAIVAVLNAFPTPAASLAEDSSEPFRKDAPEASIPIPESQAGKAIPEEKAEAMIIEFSRTPQHVPKASIMTPPPLGASRSEEEAQNSISFSGKDGNGRQYSVPQASSESMYVQKRQMQSSRESYRPYPGGSTARYATNKSGSNSYVPGACNAPGSSPQGGYGFYPASSPSTGINDCTFDLHKSDYGFMPASRP
jgi:serine/threonine protein kinase